MSCRTRPATKNPQPAAAASRIAAGQRSRGMPMPSPAHDHQPATARSRSPPRKTAASPTFVLTIAGTDTVVSFRSGSDLGAPLGPGAIEDFPNRQAPLAGDPADLLELRRHRDRLPAEARHLEGDRPQRRVQADKLPGQPRPADPPPAYPDAGRLAEEEVGEHADATTSIGIRWRE